MAGVRLIRSPVSVAGMVLTTVSAVLFLVVFLADLFGLHTNPYIGIVFFLVLPAIFLLGLALIPLGAWRERRRRAAGKTPSEPQWPRIDLNDPVQRQRAVVVFALTMANIIIVSLAAYRGVEYMDSVEFCGLVCHTPMKPEFVAHRGGAHARVPCVGCHVGPGPSSFAGSKLTGTQRAVAVALDNYPRPIVASSDRLISARESCERCHSPEQFHGDKTVQIREYSDTEQNTESVTTLHLHVGGGSRESTVHGGIHWHMNLAKDIEFISLGDDRQMIPYVRTVDSRGETREYVVDGVTAEQLAAGNRRRMDCLDCHNRPSHAIAATPQRAVNESMARGDLPKTLPFVHREAVKALEKTYASESVASRDISEALQNFYRTSYPHLGSGARQDVDKAVLATVRIYRDNVFPEMNVKFGTYPNNIGHVDFPGCFRCHDDEHKSRDGKKISQDCETCHTIE